MSRAVPLTPNLKIPADTCTYVDRKSTISTTDTRATRASICRAIEETKSASPCMYALLPAMGPLVSYISTALTRSASLNDKGKVPLTAGIIVMLVPLETFPTLENGW